MIKDAIADGNVLGFSVDYFGGAKLKETADKEVTGIDFNTINTDEEAIALAKEKGIELPESKLNRGYIINEFFEEFVESTLIQPTFIYDYPIEVSPLTKKKPSDGRLTERFEVFTKGSGRQKRQAQNDL